MGFERLLGNERLKQGLTQSLRKGHVSHFYLISGPIGSGRHTLARLLAEALLCREPDAPCGRCRACRKVQGGNHPDLLTVDEPEKKTISVERVRALQTDVYVRPNEAEHKVYLFPRAGDLGLPAQNALLKLLEEPPRFTVFILVTDNAERLLPTVRSRCVELTLTPLPRETLLRALRERFPALPEGTLSDAAAQSCGCLGTALSLCETGTAPDVRAAEISDALAAGNRLALLEALVPLEKQGRDTLLSIMQTLEAALCSALTARTAGTTPLPLAVRPAHTRSAAQLMTALNAVQTAEDYLRANVSPATVCGYLTWALLGE